MDGEREATRMTIDELARRSGLSARNIRAYQSKGLLPAPTLEGRVGYYDEGHLARLRLITRLHRQGFSLASVANLVQAWEQGRGLADVLGLEEQLTAPWSHDVAQVLTIEDLVDLFPGGTAKELTAAIDLGYLEPTDDGRFLARNYHLLEIGADLARMGIPLGAALAAAGAARERLSEVAADFHTLFERHVWQPFVQAGMPAERFVQITEILLRLRPIAFDTVASTFAAVMDEQAEELIGRFVPAPPDGRGAKKRRSPARRGGPPGG